ncbi:hypothetical protein I4O28_06125 [Clostridioides difficile]|uniref:hypothetical protein n=1 Tax=Clostridioides difficile TaxID=1496 RepID=UPI00038D7D13|nr:hypothetical protein [Clostridioides difficile]EII6832847.1 hypothetical protein [Clostridioides difficile]EQJ88622.1 hypothetical protein QUC_3349 [Clostridioides difficile P50]KAK2245365.1 hypothetical protein XC29_00590 [Clostridioides difficile]MBF9984259.1 hypothetical protein [Clostridioides difficile]MBH7250194.1 hypothetical protein [Clostridioides difficile]
MDEMIIRVKMGEPLPTLGKIIKCTTCLTNEEKCFKVNKICKLSWINDRDSEGLIVECKGKYIKY